MQQFLLKESAKKDFLANSQGNEIFIDIGDGTVSISTAFDYTMRKAYMLIKPFSTNAL